MTLFHENCVQNDIFSDVRFVGDILVKTVIFMVFLEILLNFALFGETLGKT